VHRARLLSASPLVIAILLAGCGSSSSSSSTASGAPASTSSSTASSMPASTSSGASASGGLAIAADPSGALKFTKTSLSAKAGQVTIAFASHAPEPHNLTIQQGTSGPTVGATPSFAGGSRTLTVKLKPGTYTFFCSIPGHRTGGMQGTLTVT
jgi:plastocyanin